MRALYIFASVCFRFDGAKTRLNEYLERRRPPLKWQNRYVFVVACVRNLSITLITHTYRLFCVRAYAFAFAYARVCSQIRDYSTRFLSHVTISKGKTADWVWFFVLSGCCCCCCVGMTTIKTHSTHFKCNQNIRLYLDQSKWNRIGLTVKLLDELNIIWKNPNWIRACIHIN